MTETDKLMALVDQAWQLCTAANDYIKAAAREVPLQEVFDKVFVPNGFVEFIDIEKTQKECGNPPKVFLKSPYGLQYRPEHNNWIPFRHGPLPAQALS